MNAGFADSFYWIALLNKLDASHSRVRSAPRPKRMVTSIAVVLEVMDALSSAAMRRTATRFWQYAFRNKNLQIVWLDAGLLDRAAALYGSRQDKNWSLTDCISFTIMQDQGISLALTGDHHFVQAGFQLAFP